MKRVALQLYSIRDMMAESVENSLMETAKAGYSGVEFAGFFGKSAKEIRNAFSPSYYAKRKKKSNRPSK